MTSPTPILDRLAPLPPLVRPSRPLRLLGWLWVVVSLGASIALLIWRPPWARSIRSWVETHLAPVFAGHQGAAGILVAALFVAVAVIAAVVLHELGHLVAGLVVGFRFNQLRLFSVQIDRPFRISRYRGRGTGSGGWASLIPARSDRLALRAVALLAAGPVVNLLSAGAVIVLVPSPGAFSAAFVVASLVLGLVNLIPFRSRAVYSDGRRILMLVRDRARGERWLALIRLGAELEQGVLPESLSPAFLATATAVRDESPDTVTAHALAFASAFHRGEDADAARALETCLSRAGFAAPVQREALMSEAGVFQARRRQRPDLAEQWLDAMPPRTEVPWLRARVEAAILEARGDPAGALGKLKEVEQAVQAEPNAVRRNIALRLARRWQADLERLREG